MERCERVIWVTLIYILDDESVHEWIETNDEHNTTKIWKDEPRCRHVKRTLDEHWYRICKIDGQDDFYSKDTGNKITAYWMKEGERRGRNVNMERYPAFRF